MEGLIDFARKKERARERGDGIEKPAKRCGYKKEGEESSEEI